jgi:two-component system, LytTR family, response regulator AlgR
VNILIVDDEALARSRLNTLLTDCAGDTVNSIQQAADALQAWAILQERAIDLVMLDIHMPGLNGLGLAQQIQSLDSPPNIIFVTAHPEHALQAFDLQAIDYLTKPVRLERLQQALNKNKTLLRRSQQTPILTIHERGKTHRVALDDVLYFKAELKYLTVRTPEKAYLLEGALNDLEQKYASRFVRIHRNALVARACIQTLEKINQDAMGENWAVRVLGVPDTLLVSRRQLHLVRQILKAAPA